MQLRTPSKDDQDEPIPDVVTAASVALAIIHETDVDGWSNELRQTTAFNLSTRQQELLDEHAAVLALIRSDGRKHLTIAACKACERWLLVPSGGTAPTRCHLTLECDGKFSGKAKAAETKADPNQPPEPAQAEIF